MKKFFTIIFLCLIFFNNANAACDDAPGDGGQKRKAQVIVDVPVPGIVPVPGLPALGDQLASGDGRMGWLGLATIAK